jgi:hypothetical protein
MFLKTTKKPLLAILFCACAAYARLAASQQSADLPDNLKNQLSDFQAELTHCAAYYSIVSKCMDNAGQPQLAEQRTQLIKLCYR